MVLRAMRLFGDFHSSWCWLNTLNRGRHRTDRELHSEANSRKQKKRARAERQQAQVARGRLANEPVAGTRVMELLARRSGLVRPHVHLYESPNSQQVRVPPFSGFFPGLVVAPRVSLPVSPPRNERVFCVRAGRVPRECRLRGEGGGVGHVATAARIYPRLGSVPASRPNRDRKIGAGGYRFIIHLIICLFSDHVHLQQPASQ